jgi:hypothetical protein
LLRVTNSKSSINPIINPNSILQSLHKIVAILSRVTAVTIMATVTLVAILTLLSVTIPISVIKIISKTKVAITPYTESLASTATTEKRANIVTTLYPGT